MKVIVEFNLPEEQAEYDLFMKAREYHSQLNDIYDRCRSYLKYEEPSLSKANKLIEILKGLAYVEE